MTKNLLSTDLVAETVKKINAKFKELSHLSNDELRTYVQNIKSQIIKEQDKERFLDSFLIEIYAAVKETARRFTEGEIIVEANDFDYELAENYDFVSIREDKAVFKNKWKVKGEDYKWEMVHYDEQISGGIYLHYGYALEMATGEGKTLVATLPVFLNALSGEGVHLMTVNEYLSERDYEITRPIYMFHGITADCIEKYSRYSDGRKKSYNSDITFGHTSEFVFDYLFDNLATDPKDWVQKNHNYVIIDEIDSILIDEANTSHFVGGGEYFSNEKIFTENAPYIEEMVKTPEYYVYKKNNDEVNFTKEGINWLREKVGEPSLFKYKKKYSIEGYNELSEEEKDKWEDMLKLQNVFSQLLKAYVVYERDVDYIVEGNKVIIIDQNTGRKKISNRWEHGLHTAVEVKEKVKVEKDFLGLGVISLKNYLNLYSKKAGMSGTILSAKEEFEEIYEMPSVRQQTHNPIIRVDKPIKIFRTQKDKIKAIINRIRELQNEGTPVLVGCQNIKKAEELGSFLEETGIKFNRLDAKKLDEEAKTISIAGEWGTVTVATSVAGRGTDIKPSKEVLSNGGLTVIGTNLFHSVRIDLQLKGRTGRQGNPGTSEYFISLEDDILDSLSEEERTELSRLSETLDNTHLSSYEVLSYFQKAQNKKEESFRLQRKEVAKKDDIVAPRRIRFYETRKKALFRTEDIDDLILRITKINGEEITNLISQHINNMYEKVNILLSKSLNYSPNSNDIWIPFSYKSRPFAIKLDIRRALQDFKYFSNEFKRSVTLFNLDSYWNEFVVYMMGNLDRKEISELDIKYDQMISDVIDSIIGFLTKSTIPINLKSDNKNEEPDSTKSVEPIHPTIHIIVTMEDFCPCGSGKKYCECHGQSIHNIKKKLR